MATLSERVALVTGGGRGIGRGIALGLAKYGAKVAVIARSRSEIEAVAGEIEEAGGEAIALPCDVSNYESIKEVIARVEDRFGAIDILVNNAAIIGDTGSVEDSDHELWTATQRINLDGVYYAIHETVPGMKKRGYGRIINISSGAGFGSGLVMASAYSVSKAALEMLSLNLAKELAGSGICVNSVRPGVVDTAMQIHARSLPESQVGEDFHALFTGFHAEGRLTDPLDVGLQIVAIVISDKHGEQLGVLEIAEELAEILSGAEPAY